MSKYIRRVWSSSSFRYLNSTNLVVQQAKIGNNTSFIFKDESICNTLFMEELRISHQELVEVAVATVEGGRHVSPMVLRTCNSLVGREIEDKSYFSVITKYSIGCRIV